MTQEYVSEVAKIHREVFPRQGHSKEWIQANFSAFPRIIIHIALHENVPVGYIQWIQKSGFREEVVLELEQIGVFGKYQGKGIAQKLIVESLEGIKTDLKKRGAKIKTVYVTTRTDNYAQNIYKKVLGVKPCGIIKDLYSADEVFLATHKI